MSVFDMHRYTVTLTVECDLPADEEYRRYIYEAVDPTECITVDLEGDPMAWFGETMNVQIVKVERS